MIAQRDLFEPIHHVAQVIFAGFETDGKILQCRSIFCLPAEPAFQRLSMKSSFLRVSPDLALRHLYSPVELREHRFVAARFLLAAALARSLREDSDFTPQHDQRRR